MPAFVKLGDIKASSTNHVVVQSESLILPTDGDDILVVKPEANDVLTGQEISDGSLAYAGSLFGEGVFKPQSIEDKGSVIFGDNHFRTGDGDSLTGIDSDGPNYISEKGFITNQLEHGPSLHDSVHCIVGGTMCSFLGIDSELQTDDLRSENRFLIERFEPAAGMNSLGGSLSPVLEDGSNWSEL